MLRQVLKSIFAFILNLLTMACCCCSSSPKIISKCGEIKGSRLKTNSGKNIFCFRGIPYALPPVGQLRFRRSRPYGAWTGIWDGTKESKKSLQPNVLAPDKHYLSEGDEDCLYLNVYTKTLDDTAKLPVVVFIHGGAFAVGSCESLLYGPQILLEKDIVLVGFNYRLGTLGSLTLETDECPGNLGLHDQFLALQWINENITEFGGDISNISLMGESAGSMSALLHLVSPVSQGLFHRVIALSGTPTTTFLHKDRRPRLYALAVAEKLGCEDLEDFDKVLLFLQSVPAKSILKLSTLFQDWDASHPMPWVPCLDTHAAEPMVPRGYVEAVNAGLAANIPVIMGTCQDEGLILTAKFFKEPSRWHLLMKEWSIWAPLLLFNRERDEMSCEDRIDVKNISRFYFGVENPAEVPYSEENILKLTDMVGLSWFFFSFDRDSKLLANNGTPVYTFILTSPPDFSVFDLFRLKMGEIGRMFFFRRFGYNPFNQKYGVCHGDDLCFLFPFNVPGFPTRVKTEEQKNTQKYLVDMVYSFAVDGVPKLSDVHWPPLSKTNSEYLDIGSCLMLTRSTHLDNQLEFWHDLKCKQEEKERIPSIRPFTEFHAQIAVNRANL